MITELKFLGNMLIRKQSTCNKFANSPIVNFLLHKTEYFIVFFTIPKAIVFPMSNPKTVSLYPAWP